jgi:hypothetical protein
MAPCATLFDNPLETSEAEPRLAAGRAPLRFSKLRLFSVGRVMANVLAPREMVNDGSRGLLTGEWRYAEEENAGSKPIEEPKNRIYVSAMNPFVSIIRPRW